jgi:hypothetical protein
MFSVEKRLSNPMRRGEFGPGRHRSIRDRAGNEHSSKEFRLGRMARALELADDYDVGLLQFAASVDPEGYEKAYPSRRVRMMHQNEGVRRRGRDRTIQGLRADAQYEQDAREFQARHLAHRTPRAPRHLAHVRAARKIGRAAPLLGSLGALAAEQFVQSVRAADGDME